MVIFSWCAVKASWEGSGSPDGSPLEEVPLIDEAANFVGRWPTVFGPDHSRRDRNLVAVAEPIVATQWLGTGGQCDPSCFLVAAGVMQLILGAAYRHYQSG